MSHPFGNSQTFNSNSILANAAGVVVPPTARLSTDAQAVLAAAGIGRSASALPSSSATLGGVSANAFSIDGQRILLSHHAQARAQVTREEDLLLRLINQQSQYRANPFVSALPGFGDLNNNLTSAILLNGPGGLASQQNGTSQGLLTHLSHLSPMMNNANMSQLREAQRELQQMDRNIRLMEDTRARQGLRTLAFIHPQTGLALPATSAGSAGFEALQKLQMQAQASIFVSGSSRPAQTDDATKRTASNGRLYPLSPENLSESSKKFEAEENTADKLKIIKTSKQCEGNNKKRGTAPGTTPEQIASGASPYSDSENLNSHSTEVSVAAFAEGSASASVNSHPATDEDVLDAKRRASRYFEEGPKRPMSAFLAFSNKRRKDLKREYPSASNADLSKMLSKKWREASDAVRRKYMTEAASLAEQYKMDISIWRKSNKRKHNAMTTGRANVPSDASENDPDSKKRAISDNIHDSVHEPARNNGNNSRNIARQVVTLFEKHQWDALTLATRVSDLCRIYDWGELEVVLFECYEKCRADGRLDLIQVINRAEALESLRPKVSKTRLNKYREQVVADFVGSLEVLVDKRNFDGYMGPLHTLENIQIVVRLLLELGTKEKFRRVEDWASKAVPSQLSSLHALFGRINPSVDPSVCRDNESKEQCVKTVGIRYKAFRIDDLKRQREELVEIAQRGEPRFTWSMPKATTESASLNSFLRCDRQGPETIIVGYGREHSRKLARKYRFDPENRKSRRDLLRNGFSATIVHDPKATGDKASITVTKTEDFHEAKVERYHKDMVRLGNICIELRELGVHVLLLGSTDTNTVHSNRDTCEEIHH